MAADGMAAAAPGYAMERLGRMLREQAATLDPFRHAGGTIADDPLGWNRLADEEAAVFGMDPVDHPLLHTTLVAWESFQTIIGDGDWRRDADAPPGPAAACGQAIRDARLARPDLARASDTPIAFAEFAWATIRLPDGFAWAIWLKRNAWHLRQGLVLFDRYGADDFRPAPKVRGLFSTVLSGLRGR